MSKTYQRRPVKNFLIKKDLQLRFIFKIVISVFITSAITLATLSAVYYYKSGSGYFYFMSNDLAQDLQRQSILATVLPSLVIAEIVSILLGVAIGLASSRKFAVPIYKIETWISNMLSGNLGSKIAFREKEEFRTLTVHCNSLSDYLAEVFKDLEKKLNELDQATMNDKAREKVAAIKKSLPLRAAQ